ALVKTIRATHVRHMDAKTSLDVIYKFLRRFRTVISLNYDLIVYWAAQLGNNELKSSYHFKDCFYKGVFAESWSIYREPYGGVTDPTIFCYPHGNIALGVTPDLAERKLSAGGGDGLLEEIFSAWNSGRSAP